MGTLAFLADLGSVIGFAFTCWAAWSAYRSKQYYMLLGRVPDGIRNLSSASRAFASAVGEQPLVRGDVMVALAEMRTAAESIARNIGKNHQRNFIAFAQHVRRLEARNEFDSDELEDLWATSKGLIASASSIVEDTKFTRG